MTGIVQEYFGLAEETDADLLAMQVGDFYEFFADDARTVADELGLKVSEKASHGSTYPMAGVPVDDLDPHLAGLVERGYRVAVADQVEDDGQVSREVVREVTPGTLLESGDAEARYLAAVVAGEADLGLAFADATTGRFHVTSVDDREAALSELDRFDPVEVLPGPDLRDGDFREAVTERTAARVTDHDPEAFAPGRATHEARDQFGDGALESVGVAPRGVAARAAGAVLSYVAQTDAGVRAALTRLTTYRTDDRVALDATTRRTLELTETMRGQREGSLLATVDHTVTAAGRRLLAEWLVRPRRDRAELRRRLDAVGALADAGLARAALRDELDRAADLERLATRAVRGSADARDLAALRETLQLLPDLVEAVESSPVLADSPVAALLSDLDRDRLATVRDELEAALVEDPPASPGDGGLFRQGYDEELDEVVTDYEAATGWLEDLADREKQRLGITHLQVDRNKTDGYYVQVGKSETDAVPEEYREIKTLKNARRYTTDEIERREREVLGLEERRAELAAALFEDLVGEVADHAEAVRAAGRALSELDVLGSLARHAAENGWTRPELTDGDRIAVTAGRHPVVEQTTEFVPNDATLDEDRRFMLVTGPNMSGKSTYMRQVALIVLLAQVGSFVPADAATVGLVDGIYTRVGALDELAGGRSTFMVEMQELSNILHSATSDSLVVLDEVGRGTATYDGISIAWAATEYLATTVGATTLFATHYHELTELADRLPGVFNRHMTAEERDGDVTFLRTVQDGPADRSYGVHVADLAGVPDPVVDRSGEVLRKLRADEAIDVRGSAEAGEPTQVVFDVGSGELREADEQTDLGDGRTVTDEAGSADGREVGPATDGETAGLDPAAEAVLEDLRQTDLDRLAPVDLVSQVRGWQERLDDAGDGDSAGEG
ncbi:MAG: DNA mismatch repair protein MutS [Halobacteriaceae archaeon]